MWKAYYSKSNRHFRLSKRVRSRYAPPTAHQEAPGWDVCVTCLSKCRPRAGHVPVTCGGWDEPVTQQVAGRNFVGKRIPPTRNSVPGARPHVHGCVRFGDGPEGSPCLSRACHVPVTCLSRACH
eukprot:2345360-Rhodomonas_salina.1